MKSFKKFKTLTKFFLTSRSVTPTTSMVRKDLKKVAAVAVVKWTTFSLK